MAALLATLLLALLALGAAGALHARAMLRAALDGRRVRTQGQQTLMRYALLAETAKGQAQPRIGGWLSIAPSEAVALRTDRGRLSGRLFDAVGGGEDAPWALLLHGGLGTDGSQMLDVACELSLAGYRVLTPDLYAHGGSDGEIASLGGGADAQDVQAWVRFILNEDADARVVILGQDEGALAALGAAASGLPDAVAAVAADSAYTDAAARAVGMLAEAGYADSALNRALLYAAYRAANGVAAGEGDLLGRLEGIAVPLLLVHGTGDQDVPAWHSEDIALATGAELYLVEGAAHGMARYVDAEGYYDALLGFFDRATGRADTRAARPMRSIARSTSAVAAGGCSPTQR